MSERERTDAESESDDVYVGTEQKRYPLSTYTPVAYDNLDGATGTSGEPDAGSGGGFKQLDLPKVPKLRHIVGPSAIMLGASIGSGETLFWPQLVARYGWGLYWLFIAAVCVQFVVNTEIQRWTLATGESIFRAFERVHPVVPLAMLVGGFVSLGWPGWAASAARIGAEGLALGTYDVAGREVVGWRLFGIILMVLIWLTYQVTPLMYNVVESVQLILVSLSIAFALFLFALIGSPGVLLNIPGSVTAVADHTPVGTIAVLVGALAYAGAGGYLNLSQSLWIREKGYGMGRYQGRIKNPFAGHDPETVHENGFAFPADTTNLQRWRGWWRVTQLEHLLTFLVGLIVVTTALVVIAVSRAPGTTLGAVDMWLVGIAPATNRLTTGVIYVTLFLALFTTEYAIVESFVRNSSDIIYELYGREAGWSLPRLFWGLLTVFCAWGVLILVLPVPIDDPFGLLVIGAAMSGLMMWPYIVVVQLVNTVWLPEHTMPGWGRIVSMWLAAAFFGYFSVLLVGTGLSAQVGLQLFSVRAGIVGSAPGGYLLWAGYGAVQGYALYRVCREKLATAGSVEDAGIARGWFP